MHSSDRDSDSDTDDDDDSAVAADDGDSTWHDGKVTITIT